MKYAKFKTGLIALAMMTSTAIYAEEVWLKNTAALKSEATAAGDDMLTAPKGTKAVLLEKNDVWAKIQVGDKVGWVALASVSNREVKRDTNLLGAGAGAEMSSGAANKGMQDDADKYATRKGLNKAAPDQMLALRKTVSSQMVKDFKAEGNVVPPAKPATPPSK